MISADEFSELENTLNIRFTIMTNVSQDLQEKILISDKGAFSIKVWT